MPRRVRLLVLAASSAVLVVVSSLVSVSLFGNGGDNNPSTVSPPVSQPTGGRTPTVNDDDLTKSAAEGFRRESLALAAKLANPQTIANAFEFTQGMAQLQPDGSKPR